MLDETLQDSTEALITYDARLKNLQPRFELNRYSLLSSLSVIYPLIPDGAAEVISELIARDAEMIVELCEVMELVGDCHHNVYTALVKEYGKNS